jgi:hypothetical protein
VKYPSFVAVERTARESTKASWAFGGSQLAVNTLGLAAGSEANARNDVPTSHQEFNLRPIVARELLAPCGAAPRHDGDSVRLARFMAYIIHCAELLLRDHGMKGIERVGKPERKTMHASSRGGWAQTFQRRGRSVDVVRTPT